MYLNVSRPPGAGAAPPLAGLEAAAAPGGSFFGAGAAAGAAYYKRDEIGVGYTWATDHMKYVGTLWDEDALHKRVNDLMEIEERMGVLFRT